MKRPKWFKLTRRAFLKLTGGAALTVGAGALIDAVLIEPRWIKLTKPDIRLKNLPPAWDGVRIAHLTDIHLGRLIGLDYVRQAVAMTNDAAPDIIVLTGDFVSQRRTINAEYGKALGQLRAREGKFAVLGNHDHWADAPGVVSMLASAGISMLTNAHRLLRRGGQGLCLAGVDDLWAGRPDLERALAGVGGNVPRILLCHNPDYAEEMASGPPVDLMLAGHTHGGQVRLPLLGQPRLPVRWRKYAAGLAAGPRCPVYTCRGLGMVGIPIRLNCRPELAIVRLRRG